ncbi:choline dehydrogenase [Kocuria flava]|uniref:Choline dehydrogenase n=1 Tax=Kocuria flava TaxID=446860 RepID=A0A2N4T0E8_9MICC|nr:GMC oxidoreductase [Kocuria flava]PLC11693.1 choline dehydrogenase [Kocuria flava]
MRTSTRILIIGSGPVGATYARLLLEARPEAQVTMIEAGPQLTERPGASVRNIADPDARARAREMSQGPQSTALRRSLGIPEDTMVEGTFTARQGTHLVDFGGPGSGHAAEFPAAAVATNVGGQGAHWTCAVPRPAFSERIPFIPDDEWDELVRTAEELVHATATAFADSPVGGAIRSLLSEEFAADLPAGYGPSFLPVAGDENPDGTMTWAGTDFVLGPLIEEESEFSRRFELHDLTLARRVLHEDGRATGAEVEDLRTGRRRTVEADAVVVAADALRSPQLLWASGIRPTALGHYLTEHPVVISTVALDATAMSRHASEEELERELARRARNPSDPVSAVNRIPFSEPEHPFAAQIMYAETPPFPLAADHPLAGNRWGYVNMGYGLRKRPRFEDAVLFDDEEQDYRGLPNMTIRYGLGEEEHREVDLATALLRRAASALGEFVAEPRLMPPGSSLHYQGTMRMGPADDGTSVADPWSTVWGFDNLVVAGNGLIPTATAVNPTLTSMAIAVRGARRLAEELGAARAALSRTP